MSRDMKNKIRIEKNSFILIIENSHCCYVNFKFGIETNHFLID
ncbi:hypothetical protein MHK_007251 [Candidatus Magnetomorum sp. HK-1]|nr:hypothetical protein MHK_007251 [Candidatus Magnetomorum sp. HK-1]